MSVSGILSIPQSRASLSLGNLKHPSVFAISQSRASQSRASQSRASQSRASQSPEYLSLGNLEHPSVSGISSSQASLSLRHISALGFYMDYIPQSKASQPRVSLSLRQRSASDNAQPRTRLSLRQRSALDNAQPRTMLSLRQPFASGITQPCALLSLVHPSASPDLAVHLTVMHRSASEYCSTTECNNSN